MLKIKSKFGSNLNSFDFQQITVSEVKKLLKDIGVNKAKSVVTIPLKLIKIGAETRQNLTARNKLMFASRDFSI